jgi:hypothetical protein
MTAAVEHLNQGQVDLSGDLEGQHFQDLVAGAVSVAACCGTPASKAQMPQVKNIFFQF